MGRRDQVTVVMKTTPFCLYMIAASIQTSLAMVTVTMVSLEIPCPLERIKVKDGVEKLIIKDFEISDDSMDIFRELIQLELI